MSDPVSGDGLAVVSRESGLAVRVRPPGVRLVLGLDAVLDGVAASDDPAAALTALLDSIDRYALDDFPKPSDVPSAELAGWLRDWVAGVRDAAAPLASDGGSGSPA